MPRDLVILECTEARKEGKPTSRYVTSRNKKLQTDKVEKNGRPGARSPCQLPTVVVGSDVNNTPLGGTTATSPVETGLVSKDEPVRKERSVKLGVVEGTAAHEPVEGMTMVERVHKLM